MSSATPPTDPPPSGRRPASPRRWWPWTLAGGAVLGLFAGGAIVAGFDIDGNSNAQTVAEASTSPTPGASVSASSGPSGASTSPGTNVNISQSCLQAISDAEGVYGEIGKLSSAISSLDAANVDTVVRQLEALQNSLGPSVKACQATVNLPSSLPPASTSLPPSATPTASPSG